MTVQVGLCRTCSETTLLVFPRGGSGCFPENWSNSMLCAIFKTGSVSDPNNYRGISLIDILNKILTGMMYKRLYSWAEGYDKIDETQSGFRKEYSAVDSIFSLMTFGQKYLSKQAARVFCLFVNSLTWQVFKSPDISV